MAFEVKVGMKLQDVKAYVEKQDYMSKEQKTKIFNFIKDDTDGVVSHNTEKALLTSLLNGKSGAVFKGFNINDKNAKNVRQEYSEYRDNYVEKEPRGTYECIIVKNPKGSRYEKMSFCIINDKNDKGSFRGLSYENGSLDQDKFCIDEKSGKITSRRTYAKGVTYTDVNGDGIYDDKQVFFDDGSVWYTRDKNGNWQMEM